MSTTIRRKLQMMMMWLWRRMIKILWMARRTSKEVLGWWEREENY